MCAGDSVGTGLHSRPIPGTMLEDFKDMGFISGMYVINREEALAVIKYDLTLLRRSAPEDSRRSRSDVWHPPHGTEVGIRPWLAS